MSTLIHLCCNSNLLLQSPGDMESSLSTPVFTSQTDDRLAGAVFYVQRGILTDVQPLMLPDPRLFPAWYCTAICSHLHADVCTYLTQLVFF